jgi:hypothetical protein
MDEPSEGILRFSGHWILTNVFVTQADILTSASSTITNVKASPESGTLPYRYEFSRSHSFGRTLSPGHCRRKNAVTSELLRTLLKLAASKRTSWLFLHSHILFHLASI